MIEEWLLAHKNEITHFRPVRMCGLWYLIAYNRNKPKPFIDGQPTIADNKDNHALIVRIWDNASIVEDPLA